MKKRLFTATMLALLALPIVLIIACGNSSQLITNALDIQQNANGSITISFEKVEGAESYKIYHGATRLTTQNLLATLKASEIQIETISSGENVFMYTHTAPNAEKYKNHYRIVPIDAQGRTIVSIQWDLGKLPNAASYEVQRVSTVTPVTQRTGANDLLFETIGKTPETNFTDFVANFDRYTSRYRIVPLDANGEQLTGNNGQPIYVIFGALFLDFEQTISFEQKLFGENMLFYDPKYDEGWIIAREVNRIHDDEMFTSPSGPAHGQFSIRRYAMNFKPGDYKDFGTFQFGYYTSVSGLGALPTDTRFYGNIEIPAPLPGGNATCTFWRSLENFEVNPADDNTVFRWAVSQAAPARRLSINIPARFDWGDVPGYATPWASGGFLSDSRFTDEISARNQQQWYTRNSYFVHSEFTGNNWNRMTHGVTGHPYISNWHEGGSRTNVDIVPIIREKPFLFVENGEYKVFVPGWQHNSKGITWNDATGFMGKGETLDLLKDFFIAQEGISATEINRQIRAGKHIFFTPGWFDLEEPIRVTRANTILLGTGYATLFPDKNNRDGAIFVDDVPGVIVAGIMLDALYNSDYLIKMGNVNANKDHSDNPSLLSDVFIRIGGYYTTPVNATISVLINSNNVIGDHLWVWRGDHGSGIGWDVNTGDWGLIVASDDVVMYGLFVEHFQKYETLWLGERGRVFFYQNESPYDPTNQAAYMSHNGTVRGWASYKVANFVNDHEAIALGMYGVFNRTGEDRRQSTQVFMDNAIEVPHKPGVWIRHAIITELSVTPNATNNVQVNGTASIVNGTGQGISNLQLATARRLLSFNNGNAILPSGHPGFAHPDCPVSHDTKTIGVEPANEDFSQLLLPIVRVRWE
jgi:hypothetical protein